MIAGRPKVVVALPSYNEGHYIKKMIAEVRKYADEVLVVDDGSTDSTARLAKLAGATVIRHGKNLGYGATIMTILTEARKRVFDALVIIDADTQHNPSDIPHLVKPVLNGYDIAIGSRSRKDIPPYRYVGGRVLSVLTRIFSGKNVFDSQSGFRCFSPRAVIVLKLREKGMAISSEMIFEAAKRNLRITEVPISVKYTKDGSTMNPVVQGFYTLFRVIVMGTKR